jgi:CRISPR/Cas system-associated exonuclease Cas4 (RecB family)
MENWKISPSDLTFLWDECPRCFYLKVRHNFRRPGLPFPKIFTKIDLLMKDIYLGESTQKISPLLPPGKTIMGGRWVTSAPIMTSDGEYGAYIQGIFDTVVQFEDGSYGVVDFKTSEAREEHIEFYGRQLTAYAYALTHPAPGKLHLSPVSKLGLLYFEPQALAEDPTKGLSLSGPARWVEIPLDEARFLEFMGRVLALLSLPEPPAANPECSFCAYREASRNTTF